LALAHAQLSPLEAPAFAPKRTRREDKGKSGTSFFEHILAVSAAASLGRGKFKILKICLRGNY
jgi:hypothetical protein